MPLNGSDVASPVPGFNTVASNTTILSALHNSGINDIFTILNSSRGFSHGALGGTSQITNWDNLTAKGTDIASGSTLVLTTTTGPRVDITGTTTVTAVTLAAGTTRIARATASFTITASATLLVNGSSTVNYKTGPGDLLLFEADSTVVSVWAIGTTDRPITSVLSQVFAASGTYTPNAHMKYCQIECLGAGGGGGGAITTTAGTINGAGGGGSGGYSRLIARQSDIGTSKTVTVGAGGAGGVAGNNAGTNGGATSVGTLCIGNGGGGGGGAAAAGAGTAGAAATAGTGDVALPGAIGTIGGFATILTVNASIFGGPGGIGAFGGSPRGRAPGSAGTAGAVKGCGGGGASDSNAGADRAGGAGSDGYVIITEYCAV